MPDLDSQTPRLLLVDDDDVDILGVRRKLKSLKIDLTLVVAHDGEEALRILRGENGEAPLSAPYVILLDLNMPRMNGIEFLSELRRDPRLHRAVVFVFSTSDALDDIRNAYDLNVAGYVRKTGSQSSLADVLSMVSTYCRLVQLPV